MSQYLNVPIGRDDGSGEEKYPRATVRKYKQSKEPQGNMSAKSHANVPLMKDSSDNSYLVSHVPSQKKPKNHENQNRNAH